MGGKALGIYIFILFKRNKNISGSFPAENLPGIISHQYLKKRAEALFFIYGGTAERYA